MSLASHSPSPIAHCPWIGVSHGPHKAHFFWSREGLCKYEKKRIAAKGTYICICVELFFLFVFAFIDLNLCTEANASSACLSTTARRHVQTCPLCYELGDFRATVHLSHQSTAGTTLAMVAVLAGNHIELVNHLFNSKESQVNRQNFLKERITSTWAKPWKHNNRCTYVAHGVNALCHRCQVGCQQDIIVFLQYQTRTRMLDSHRARTKNRLPIQQYPMQLKKWWRSIPSWTLPQMLVQRWLAGGCKDSRSVSPNHGPWVPFL